MLLAHGQGRGALRAKALRQRIEQALRNGPQGQGGKEVRGGGGGVHGKKNTTSPRTRPPACHVPVRDARAASGLPAFVEFRTREESVAVLVQLLETAADGGQGLGFLRAELAIAVGVGAIKGRGGGGRRCQRRGACGAVEGLVGPKGAADAVLPAGWVCAWADEAPVSAMAAISMTLRVSKESLRGPEVFMGCI